LIIGLHSALEWRGASRAEPLPLEGLRERYLPACAFRRRQNAKLRYAVLTAAAVHGGTEPNLLDEVASWQADDFWQYAMYAAAAYIRAAARRAGISVPELVADLRRLEVGHRVGRRSSGSSVACHLKNCWSARNWLLA
jgi:hypothetical protein